MADEFSGIVDMLENFFIERMISKFSKLCFCLGLLVYIPCFLNIVLDSQVVEFRRCE